MIDDCEWSTGSGGLPIRVAANRQFALRCRALRPPGLSSRDGDDKTGRSGRLAQWLARTAH